MSEKTIRQTILLAAAPEAVFEALMDSKKHSTFTGAKAKIGRAVGEKFSAYDDYISGINLEIVPNKKIVQSWRGTEPEWKGHEDSKVSFEFFKSKKGAKLVLVHQGVPEALLSSIKQGWTDYYWKPLKDFLVKK